MKYSLNKNVKSKAINLVDKYYQENKSYQENQSNDNKSFRENPINLPINLIKEKAIQLISLINVIETVNVIKRTLFMTEKMVLLIVMEQRDAQRTYLGLQMKI